MNLDDYSTVEDNQRYINPQVSLDEQNAFIKNLREVQSADTAQIAQETHDLGTDVPSNLGGLTGSEGYFASRYQTPQTNALVADLRAAAQAQALNDAMSNELAKAKRRYSNAYKAAQKRASSSYYPTTNTNPDAPAVEGDVEYDTSDSEDKQHSTSLAGSETPADKLPPYLYYFQGVGYTDEASYLAAVNAWKATHMPVITTPAW